MIDRIKIINNTLEKEGLYSYNILDNGGKTMYGITEKVARNFGYKGSMEKLTKEQAIEIYSKLYWRKEFESFNEEIASFLFDCHVNHGYKGMSIILQKSINYLTSNNVIADGYAGNITYSTALKLDQKRLFIILNAVRCMYYLNICDKNESQETFIYGWLKNRINWSKVGDYIES